jgi:hypothetical protein
MLDLLLLPTLDHALVVARRRVLRYRSSIASAMLRASGVIFDCRALVSPMLGHLRLYSSKKKFDRQAVSSATAGRRRRWQNPSVVDADDPRQPRGISEVVDVVGGVAHKSFSSTKSSSWSAILPRSIINSEIRSRSSSSSAAIASSRGSRFSLVVSLIAAFFQSNSSTSSLMLPM